MKDQFKTPITSHLAKKLISIQFPEYSHLTVVDVEKQGHDNRTYRLGKQMLIRMPSAQRYANRFMGKSMHDYMAAKTRLDSW